MARTFTVEVAYARPEAAVVVSLPVAEGTTIQGAIEQSGILARCPEIDLARHAVGVFGEVRPLAAVLRPGDRVEIYRPLVADPKERRRRRARG